MNQPNQYRNKINEQIKANWEGYYGERYRYGEKISTAFVESTVNEVISKRMVKKQQMHWTKRGAHLLLQVRVQTLNDDLRDVFCRWHPDMTTADTESEILPLTG